MEGLIICKPLQAGVLKGSMRFKGLFRGPRGGGRGADLVDGTSKGSLGAIGLVWWAF